MSKKQVRESPPPKWALQETMRRLVSKVAGREVPLADVRFELDAELTGVISFWEGDDPDAEHFWTDTMSVLRIAIGIRNDRAGVMN